MRLRLLLAALGLACLPFPAARAEMVALGSFRHADFERNDPDTSTTLAIVVQAGLDEKSRWKFVERGEVNRILDELGLSRSGLTSADTAARVGRLLKADLMLSGTFFTPKDAKPYVVLECDELARAEPAGQVRVELGNVLEKGHLTLPSAEDIRKIVAAGDRLLETSTVRLATQANQTVLKMLFLANRSGDRSLNGLERLVTAGLELAAATAGSTHRMLQLERPEIATQESELALLGLVEADPTAWAQVADYYVWGSARSANDTITVSLTVWDGRGPPQDLIETGRPQELPALAGRLVEIILSTARPVDRRTLGEAGTDQRDKVAALLGQQARGREVEEKRRLLAAAIFFSPGMKENWMQLLEVRRNNNNRSNTLPELLRRVGDLEYALEVAERFLVSPQGKIDPLVIAGVADGFSRYANDQLERLLDGFSYFQEDLKDVYVGRNLLALQQQVTTGYRRHVMQLGRMLAVAGAGQDDEFRQTAEFILTTALQRPFTDKERTFLIDALLPRLKVAVLVHRAWYPTGDRRRQLDDLLRTHYLDLHQVARADALDILSPSELAAALAAPAPANSPGWDKLHGVEIAEVQIAQMKRNAPSGQARASAQKHIENRVAAIAGMKIAYAALQVRAAAFLQSHSEAGAEPIPAGLLQGPVDDEVTLFCPPLETYPTAAKRAQVKWLRDTADERAKQGLPAAPLARMRARADALEREVAADPAGSALPVTEHWSQKKPDYLDPWTGGQRLAFVARRGDLPSLQALLALGVPIESIGAALVEAIQKEQWPAATYLLAQGYDPTAPWPEIRNSMEPYAWDDHPGPMALAEAAVHGRKDIVDLLLKKGVRFDAKSVSGNYAVLELTKSRRAGLLRQVLAAGANPNTHFQHELQPLYHAVRAHDIEVLQALLDGGADPTELLGRSITMSTGLDTGNQWDKYDDRLLGERGLDFCARENWLEGARAMLALSGTRISEVLQKERPHRDATLPAVRAVFLRAELEAASRSPAADRAGIDLFTAIAAKDEAAFASALAQPGSLAFRGLWGETALMLACEEKATALALRLLEAGVRLDEFDSIGSTPLCYAARNGDIGLVDAMMLRGADINLSRGRANRPLDQAIMEGRNAPMALKLLALHASLTPHPRKPDLIPLFVATTADLPEVVREMVRLGSDPNQLAGGFSVFFPAARSNNPELIQYYYDLKCDLNRRNSDDWTPLMSAVRWGAAASVQKLLELGLRDPNAAALSVSMVKDLEPAERPSPEELRHLHYRPDYRRCLEIMEEFGQITGSPVARDSVFWHVSHTVPEMESYVAAGGNVNFRGFHTPLQDAASMSDASKAAFLLAKGADPNLVGTGPWEYVPLAFALEKPEIVELLLRHGANPNDVTHDASRWTILARACVDTRVPVETIRLLIRYGANPNIDAREKMAEFGSKDLPETAQKRAALDGK